MKAGDIVRILAPIAGYKKYHFCICLPQNGISGKFLFLNSDPSYKDCLNIDCSKISFLPPSETGFTSISFSIFARYTDEKLNLYEAEVLGEMPREILAEMLEFLKTVKSLPRPDKELVRDTLNDLLS